MDPKFLSQLAVIVELGSVTKAARKLNVTQPTLSRSIKIIEHWVGGAVLRRGRYGVMPTDIGMRLAEEGRGVLRRSEQARIAIQEWRHGLSGELRVGVGPMLAATIMGDFFAETLIAPPTYGLKIDCEYATRLVERLSSGELDAAIIPYDLTCSKDTLFREVLFQDRLAVFVGEDDSLVGQKNVSPKALAEHHWISIGEVAGLFNTTRQTLDQLGLHDVTPKHECTGDINMILRMLEKTKACCIVPFRQLGVFQERFHVAPIDLDVELPTRNVALWTTISGRDRPEIIDFLVRFNDYLGKVGLK